MHGVITFVRLRFPGHVLIHEVRGFHMTLTLTLFCLFSFAGVLAAADGSSCTQLCCSVFLLEDVTRVRTPQPFPVQFSAQVPEESHPARVRELPSLFAL